MSTSSENGDRTSLQSVVDQHTKEIVERRQTARASRAKALGQHPEPINVRTEISRAKVADDLTASAAPPPPVASSTQQTAGYLLAIGDSWFDYPIHDVLTKLDDNYGYNVESSAHKGDPIEAMVSHVGQFDKFARCIDAIISLGAAPKAVLVSGGGDDVAGTEFGMLINSVDLSDSGWNEHVLAGVIDDRVATAYRKMFLTINSLCQKMIGRTFPILVHGYDYPVPDGRGFLGGWGPLPGPWLKPGFDEKLFSDLAVTTQMMVVLIDRFNAMLANVIAEPGFENVHYVNVRGTLSNKPSDYEDWWANELHPTGDTLFGAQDGFASVAKRFQDVLATLPNVVPNS